MLEADAEAEGEADEDEAEDEARGRADEPTRPRQRPAKAPTGARRLRRRAPRGASRLGRHRLCAPRPSTCGPRRERRVWCATTSAGKSVEEARAILAHTPRAVARDWSKLLESAVANAENNHELVGEDLYVKAVHADEGPTIRRFRPRAMGRATRIRKRTSHLTILLTPKD